MKRPFSERVRFYLVHGRWPKLEARMLLAMVAAALATPPESVLEGAAELDLHQRPTRAARR